VLVFVLPTVCRAIEGLVKIGFWAGVIVAAIVVAIVVAVIRAVSH
jgi:hypothetical protein